MRGVAVGEVLVGTTLLASFLAGVVALLAPCCVSVMLPAYLATGFRHRGGVVPATLIFGAGVATIILPIGLGATALSRLFIEQHVWLFSIGGLLMIAGGVAVLAGWKPNLPMPGARSMREGSFASAYVLGAFSGVASACCAPVLAGVAVLAGASASFPAALAIGGAYVAGMVAPLAVIALVWDRRRERATRLLTERTVRLGFGRRLPLGTAVSGLLMIGMGLLADVLAFTEVGMGGSGWQREVSARLQHIAAHVRHALSWLPGWALAVLLLAGAALLLRRALRSRRAANDDSCACPDDDTPAPVSATVDEDKT